MGKSSFFAELQRRHVYKFGAAYAVAGWLLVQIITQVFPIYDISAHVQRIFVGVIIAGFPLALIFAWLFDLTPDGIMRTEALSADGETPSEQQERRGTDRRLNYVLVALLLLALGYIIAEHTILKAAGGVAISTAAANDKSIAVLPFENLSDDKSNAYFATGIQDEILTRLAKIGALKVISRTSTQHYASSPDNLPEIARQLGVANILEGTVQKAGDAVHINVQLIRASNDEHLWAESYNRKLDDIFAVEGEVAGSIAEALRARLSSAQRDKLSERPTQNAAAYDAYLRGLVLEAQIGAHAPGAPQSSDEFRQAVDLDPQFGLAWAALSSQQSFLTLYEGASQHLEAAKSALAMATKFAPDAIETLLADGFYHYWVEHDYEAAKIQFRKVAALAPSNSWAPYALAAIARRQSQWELSRQLFDQAIALDPQNLVLLVDAARGEMAARRTAEAELKIKRGLIVSPGSPSLIAWQVVALQMEGRFDEAQKLLDPLRPELGDGLLGRTLVNQARLTRQYAPAIQLLEDQLPQLDQIAAYRAALSDALGDLQSLSGDAESAAQTYRNALAASEDALREEPDNAERLSWRAQANAGLGNRAAALADQQHAIRLRPASVDAMDGPVYEEGLVRLQARFGDCDAAFDGLRHLLSTNYAPPPLTTANLRVDPDFTSLHDDPRWAALLETFDRQTTTAAKP
jgi:TolB-like protein/Flp pilus assembly protein TadD